MSERLWQTKLHARLHDPAEKALVLLRDPAGHEGGTSRALHRSLGFEHIADDGELKPDHPDTLGTVLFKNGVPADIYKLVQRADWWAAAADRPQWPMEEIVLDTGKTRKIADWAQVRWTKRPILIHPLSGKQIDLKSLADTDIHDIKQRSREHFQRLSIRNENGTTNWRRTLFAYWRFGPELSEDKDNGKLGLLWPLLPADTRVPDHSIWDHLDLTSAFAGAFTMDDNEEATLLTVSLGPVQSFIAAARSTSDLWAGSHLLARLSWEAMKVVCEQLGPDAILFPRLRGIPQVDVWLRDECGLPKEWFKDCEWRKGATDSNPLFNASLPNRFVALAPGNMVQQLTEKITSHVRQWLLEKGMEAVDRLLETAKQRQSGHPRDESVHAYSQMREQLSGFPEVHWAAVPFSLIGIQDEERQRDLDTSNLSAAMAPFFGAKSGNDCGFLDSPAWRVLDKNMQWDDNTTFWSPNPGALYPAIYDLAERVLASAKAARPFEQIEQRGWRCSLTGESEWLTTDPAQLEKSYRQQTDTLWNKIAAEKPAWAKKGEHLGALSAIKRVWPTLFAREVAGVLPTEQSGINRFVVSTHTMALAHQLKQLSNTEWEPSENLLKELNRKDVDAVALPRHLLDNNPPSLHHIKQLPSLLDTARESDNDSERMRLEKLIKDEFRQQNADFAIELENYYALLMFDGDHMGKILSGETNIITYCESFHPQVRSGFISRSNGNETIKSYADQARAISPNRHLAISAALNDFALHVVPEIVEREHPGRLIYAGGDDVLAMLPIADLLSTMQRLRNAYSGITPEGDGTDWNTVRHEKGLVCKDGFAWLCRCLMRMMGNATASCGAVVAHHKTPLTVVLRELRAAEQRAKNEGGRDAFSLSILKRSGGDLHFTAKWGESVDLIKALRRFLAEPAVSRRAVYHSLVWLQDLPDTPTPDMLSGLLRYQLERQTTDKTVLEKHDVQGLTRRITEFALPQQKPKLWLENLFSIAEFLAREVRAQDNAP